MGGNLHKKVFGYKTNMVEIEQERICHEDTKVFLCDR